MHVCFSLFVSASGLVSSVSINYLILQVWPQTSSVLAVLEVMTAVDRHKPSLLLIASASNRTALHAACIYVVSLNVDTMGGLVGSTTGLGLLIMQPRTTTSHGPWIYGQI